MIEYNACMPKTDLFAKKLLENEEGSEESFLNTKMELSDSELQEISTGLECGRIIFSTILPTRKLTLAYSKDDFQVFLAEKISKSFFLEYEIQTSSYFVFFIQTQRGLFLILASTFDFLGYVSGRSKGNPFEEQDLMHEIMGKIGKTIKIQFANYYMGLEELEMNLFESKKGVKFFAFQI